MDSPLKYKKMSGFATTSGQLFEVNLAGLLFLRGINSGQDFQLGTNVQGAGAMDDVIFRFKTPEEPDHWTTLYVQLKHKEKSRVNRKMLTSPKGDFSLASYFKSYLDIKNTMSSDDRVTLLDGIFEKCMFVVFTNAKASESLKDESSTNLSRAEKFIFCSDSGTRFSFEGETDILECLGECGSDGEEFLGRLRVFCDQPKVNELKTVVRNELFNLSPEMVHGVDIGRLCDIFLDNAKVWWETSNYVLHKGHDLLHRSLGQARLEMSSQKTLTDYSLLELVFEDSALLPFRDTLAKDFLVAIEPSESSCRLTLTKLVQSIGDQVLALSCEGMLANKEALLSQWRKGEVHNLIILAKDCHPMLSLECLEIVKDMLTITRVAFLSSDGDINLTKEFPLKAKRVKDTFLFSQLRKLSRLNILAKEINFHGHKIVLSKLLDDSSDSADCVLDASSVVEVLECVGSLTLGSALEEGIEYYVERSLEQSTVIKPSLFQEDALLETVTVRVMQTETSFDIRNAKGDSITTPGFSITPGTNMKPDIVEQVIQYLSSLTDVLAFQHYLHTEEVAKNIFQTVLIPDESDSEISMGHVFPFGSYLCSKVVLRFGQDDAVTALRIRSINYASRNVYFLFVPHKTNENDIVKLANFHQSRHLLSLKGSDLRWIASTGDIEFIRRHLDEAQVSQFAPTNIMDVEDRLVLVCGEPGIGKSTLVAKLARNTKEAFPHFFVIPVALSDHSQLFAENKSEDVLGFLTKAAKIESHLHQSLFEHALKVTGNIVVLLDGYDEVAPKYIKQSNDMLESLLQAKVNKFWITSRNSMKIKLEGLTSKLAFRLRKFDEEDQRAFLKMFWVEKSTLDAAELDKFTRQLLGNISQTVREKESNFMGVPLQTRILAEVYEGHVTGLTEKSKLPENLDLLVLLDKFVEKKCHVFVQAKLQISPHNPNYEYICASSIKRFIDSHACAALFYLLGEEYLNCLEMGSIVKESLEFFKEIKHGKDKTGFIDAIVNGKPRFAHLVFAEYFAAYWISKHYENNRKIITANIFRTDIAVVRQIFDRILARPNALHTAVLTDDLEAVRTLLESEVDVIKTTDLGGRTALHLAASRGTSTDRDLNVRRCKILDLLIDKTRDFDQVDKVLGCLPIQYADCTQSWAAIDKLLPNNEINCQLTLTSAHLTDDGMLESIFDLDLSTLLGFCLDNGLAVEHCAEGKKRLLLRACELGSFHVALLLDRKADIVNRNVVQERVVDDTETEEDNFILDEDTFSGNVLGEMLDRKVSTLIKVEEELPAHVAAAHGHVGIVKLLHHHYLSTLGNELTHKSSKGVGNTNTIADFMDIRGKNGATTIHVAARNGHSDVIRFLLGQGADPLSLARKCVTPLHLAGMNKHPSSFRILFEALPRVNRGDAVQLSDYEKQTLLLCVILGGCVECFRILVQFAGYCTQGNCTEFTPLTLATLRGNLEVVETLVHMYEAHIEGLRKSDYINKIPSDGVTDSAMHMAACHEKPDIISFLISHGGDPCCLGSANITPLHLAALLKRPASLRVLLAALGEADRAAALNLSVDNGNNVLMCAVEGGCIECVEILVQAGAKISQVNDEGRTTLMVAANCGQVKHLLNNFNDTREQMSKLDFINMKGTKDLSALHIAASEGKSEVISLLLSEGADTHSYSGTKTPLHLAVEGNHLDSVRILLEALDDREADVNLLDHDGNNVLMCAIRGGGFKCVELLVQAGAKLSQAGDKGLTPLMIAAELGHQWAVEVLLKNFNAEKEGLRKIDYINKMDKDRCSAIHFGAWKGHSDVIRFLISQGGDIMIADCDGSTPLHLAALFKHPASVRVLIDALDREDLAVSVNVCDLNRDSVLRYASLGGCLECVQLLIMVGGKLTQANLAGQTPLMTSAEFGNHDIVRNLLTKFKEEVEGSSLIDYINMKDDNGWTALHKAAWKGHSDVVSTLISHGVDPQNRTFNNSTPLHLAALYKHPGTVSALLDAMDGVDLAFAVNCCDIKGNSVLSYASLGGCLDCIQLLIMVGGKLTQANLAGQTPLMASAEFGNHGIVRNLLNLFREEVEGSSLVDFINMKDDNGLSALHKAAWKGHSDAVSALISHGGDSKIRTFNNSTPLTLAAKYKHPRVVKVLLDALDEADRADAVNSFDNDGDTALLLAASVGSSESVELLLQAGAKQTRVKNNNMTPLMAAAANNHLPVVINLVCLFDEQTEGMNKVEYMTLMNKGGQTALNLAGTECRDTLETFLRDMIE